MKTEIRIYRTKNVLAVRALDSTLWAEHCTDTFSGHEVWLAENSAGRLVGYASLKMVDDGKAGFLAKSGVLREARGQGLQKRLIKARERRAKQLGATHVITYTSTDNLASANSLISCGYKLYQPARNWGLPFPTEGMYFRRKLEV